MKTVFICDDHPFTLMGTKAYVEATGYKVVGLSANGIEALNLILNLQPDIALLDFNMPGLNGLELLEQLKAKKAKTKIVLLTMHKETSIYKKAAMLGVNGYVLKEQALDVLEQCLESVSKGENWFSKELQGQLIIDASADEDSLDRFSFVERKIIKLIGQQIKSKEIAQSLFISEKTVENHRSNIIKKLGLPNEKNALLVWALGMKDK